MSVSGGKGGGAYCGYGAENRAKCQENAYVKLRDVSICAKHVARDSARQILYRTVVRSRVSYQKMIIT